MGKYFNYYLPSGAWVCKHGVTTCHVCIPPHIQEIYKLLRGN